MTAALSSRRILAFGLIAALLFGGAWGWRAIRTHAGHSDLSDMARRVVRSASPPYREVRGTMAWVVAADERHAAALLEEAEQALPEIARRLAVPLPARPVRILMVSDSAVWDELVRGEGFRPDSLAVNAGGEIFLKSDAAQGGRPDRLAHELVHFVLREHFGADVPLWLDEGLASRIGVAVSRAYRIQRGRRVNGAWPAVPVEALEPLSVLTSRRTLPDDPASARVFYRAAEELVAIIEDRIGSAHLPDYVAEVVRGADWRAALDARLKGSAHLSDDIESVLRRQVAAPRKL